MDGNIKTFGGLIGLPNGPNFSVYSGGIALGIILIA